MRGGGGAGRGAPQTPDAAPVGGAGGGEGALGPRAHQWPQRVPRQRLGGERGKGRRGRGRARRAPCSPQPRHADPKMKDYFKLKKKKKTRVSGGRRGRGSAGGGKPGRVAPGHPPACAHPLPFSAAAELAPRVRTPGAESPEPAAALGKLCSRRGWPRKITRSWELRLQVTATPRARGGGKERPAKQSPAQVWRLAGPERQRGGLREPGRSGERERGQGRERRCRPLAGWRGGRPPGRAGGPGI